MHYIARGIATNQTVDSANVGMNNIVATGTYKNAKSAVRYMKKRAEDAARSRCYARIAIYDAVGVVEVSQVTP